MEALDHDALLKLADEASAAARQGDRERAARLFDEGLAACAGNPSLDDVAVNLLYNKATFLRLSSRLAEAVAIFDDILSRFELTRGDETIRRWVVLARFNRAVALEEAGDAEHAADAFGDFAAALSDDPASFVRQRVARALFQRAMALRALGRDDAARAGVRSLIESFGVAPETEIQSVIGAAIKAWPSFVTLLPPAGHPGRSAFDAAVEAETRMLLKDDPELLQEHLADYQRTRSADLEREAQLHAKAVEILTKHHANARPLGLLLRSFSLESSQTKVAVGTDLATQLVVARFNYDEVETRLLAAIAGRAPVIGVVNPLFSAAGLSQVIPKFAFRNEVWTQGVSALIDTAAFIVVLVEKLANGLELELELIVRAKKEASTLLVRMDPAALDGASMTEVLHQFANVVDVSELTPRAAGLEWFDRRLGAPS